MKSRKLRAATPCSMRTISDLTTQWCGRGTSTSTGTNTDANTASEYPCGRVKQTGNTVHMAYICCMDCCFWQPRTQHVFRAPQRPCLPESVASFDAVLGKIGHTGHAFRKTLIDKTDVKWHLCIGTRGTGDHQEEPLHIMEGRS